MTPRLKIISASLYGNCPTYTVGAIENAKLVSAIYPGWVFRLYVKSVPADTLSRLSDLGCQVVEMDWGLESGTFWRFLAASDEETERAIFRDCDSRINVREAAAVSAWIDSGKSCHVMRDHVHHCAPHSIHPIFAGMWGVVGGRIRMYDLIREWRHFGNGAPAHCDDQDFLKEKVWPLVRDSCCIHDYSNPFPSHPPYDGFVGQRFDQFNARYPD
jgi:hypothetical protein